MGPLARQIIRRIVSATGVGSRAEKLKIEDMGFGYDSFGAERETILLTYAASRLLYRYYFRVESHGHEYIPRTGSAVFTANHAGMLPYDAAMAEVDLIEKMDPPRLLRAVVDRFVANIPMLNVLISRTGNVIGCRRNVEELLQAGELVLVFPEGAAAIGKPFTERYRLQPFRVGFIELALRHKVPVIPTAFIGSEEQAPVLLRLEGIGRKIGIPFIPVTPTFPLLGPLGAIPLPARYYIYYGEPIHLYREYPPQAADDPRKLEELAERVRGAVARLIDRGLRHRDGIFL